MPNLKGLMKDTAIYGLSSIVGRFLNYWLVPLYTHYMPTESGDYGISTNVYAYTALILVLLTFGMETTLFRFANEPIPDASARGGSWPDRVFSTGFALIATLTALFLLCIFGFITPIADHLGYSEHPDYLLMMSVVVAMDALQALPFSYLRFQKRPVRFATLKLLFIFFNIGLNLLFFVVLHKTSVFYVFAINLACTSLITLCFIPEFFKIQWQLDWALLRRMLSYSWPILILGVAGILNQVADKILFPVVYPDKAEANVQLGIYGGCVKIAMIMAMITQAFRYAYEPIVFAKARDKDSTEYYAVAMKYFLIFTLLAFLCVVGYLDVLQFILGKGYREGMQVVPIVMVAEIMMGVYFNLSFWYKLIDRTIYGAVFSLIGCAVLFAVNILFIPTYSYMACAWGGVAGYGTAMVLSYIVGQVKNPIPYPMKSLAVYVLLTAAFYAVMHYTAEWHLALRLALNTVLILLFCAHVWYHELRKPQR
ncbi:MAG: lipopolysaccharide biosynthesis protein [Bacteroidaceae bacterium]|nr:lipopolysaccharide biosynthesis protein [Bacteroidaceae bacterium]